MPKKMPKEAKAKRDGVINPQNYNFNQILTRKILMLSNATNQPKSTVEPGYISLSVYVGQNNMQVSCECFWYLIDLVSSLVVPTPL